MDHRQTAKADIVLAKPRHAAHLADMSKRLIEQGLTWHCWTTKRMIKAIKRDDNVTIICCQGREILGFAAMQFGEEIAHLNLLAVEGAQQSQGHASAMLDWLEESCLVAGIRTVNLECRLSNRHAIGFYQKRGFKRGEEIRQYYCGSETALRMRKRIGATLES